PVVFRDVVDSRDVIVIELRSLFGLFVETAAELRVLAVFGPDCLHGDSPLELSIFGKKHLAHSTAAESCLDDETFVTAAHVDGSLRHGYLPRKKSPRRWERGWISELFFMMRFVRRSGTRHPQNFVSCTSWASGPAFGGRLSIHMVTQTMRALHESPMNFLRCRRPISWVHSRK